jgi:stage IV sporulation protein FB
LFFSAAAFLTGILPVYLLTLLFIFVHEAGHIAAAIIFKASVNNIRLLPVGLNAGINDGLCSKGQRIFIFSAGPFISFLLAILFALLKHFGIKNSFIPMGLLSNLYLGIFNLLPVLPLDGGKITMELLSAKFGILRTGRAMQVISYLLAITIVLTGFLCLINNRSNVSLIIVGIYILMCVRTNREETAFMNIKSLLFRKSRVVRKGIYPVRELVVLKNVKLAEVIKACDYIDRFHIVNVLDDNLRIIKVMTEQELIDAIIGSTPDTTFDNLIHMEYNVH